MKSIFGVESSLIRGIDEDVIK